MNENNVEIPAKVVASSLLKQYGYWEDHPSYPAEKWECAVSRGETRSGYWEWVAVQVNRKTNRKTNQE